MQVCGDIFTDRGVGAAAGFDGHDSGGGERGVTGKEFGVFPD